MAPKARANTHIHTQFLLNFAHLCAAGGSPNMAPPSFSLGFDGSDRGGRIAAAKAGVLQSNLTPKPRVVPGAALSACLRAGRELL